MLKKPQVGLGRDEKTPGVVWPCSEDSKRGSGRAGTVEGVVRPCEKNSRTCPGYAHIVQGVFRPCWEGPMDAEKVKDMVSQCWKGPFRGWVVLRRSNACFNCGGKVQGVIWLCWKDTRRDSAVRPLFDHVVLKRYLAWFGRAEDVQFTLRLCSKCEGCG